VLVRLAAWCYERRRLVLATWIVVAIAFVVLGSTAGGTLVKSYDLPNTDSSAAFAVLKRDFAQPGDTGQVVFGAKGGTDLRNPDAQAAIARTIGELAKQPEVLAISSPFDPRFSARQIAPDGTVAYGEIQFDRKANDVSKDVAQRMRDIAAGANTSTMQVELGGSMFGEFVQPASEGIGVAAAMLILLVAFGSVIAMGLPIMIALFGIAVGLAVEVLVAHLISIPDFATQVTAMIGLGVGIDYALFIVTRFRNGLHDGLDPKTAVTTAINTAGRAVLFAGCTVVISFMGLFVIGLGFIQGLAVGCSLAVLLVMAATVTLLPAMLGFAGRAVDRLALKSAKRSSSTAVEHSLWARWSRTLQRHPWPVAVSGLVVLLVLAVPALSLRLGSADAGNAATSQTVRRAYDLLARGFGPGTNGPLLVTAEITGPHDLDTLGRLAARLHDEHDVAQVSPVIPSPNGKAALVTVIPKGSPQDESTIQLIHHLRADVVPAATAGTPVIVHVGGQTAAFADLADKMGARLPVFLFAVLVLSFVLLLLVFRSVLVPLKAVVMNLLSIAATYGVIVAVFQWGWLSSVVGIGKPGPIESWAPMMLFAVVFGLSMDYEVFLLSRIREEYDLTRENATAVAHGLAATARLITAAAAIMICVFGAFVIGDDRVLKLIGLGLASAVFIDATVVRLVLVPATMELLGDRNWWLPKRLHFLPRLHVEPEAVAATSSD